MATFGNSSVPGIRRMEDYLTELWDHLGDRVVGPMHFRLVMQPAMATFFGIRDGLRFAREGRSFLLWGGPTDSDERHAQFVATWRAIGKVFVLALLLDAIYQMFILNGFYPLEAAFVAIAVALAPYFLVRFLVNSLARLWQWPKPPKS